MNIYRITGYKGIPSYITLILFQWIITTEIPQTGRQHRRKFRKRKFRRHIQKCKKVQHRWLLQKMEKWGQMFHLGLTRPYVSNSSGTYLMRSSKFSPNRLFTKLCSQVCICATLRSPDYSRRIKRWSELISRADRMWERILCLWLCRCYYWHLKVT